ncbi:MAG: hypothetical protein ABIP71_08760, partial [Verrucomicrobiota bacterium]
RRGHAVSHYQTRNNLTATETEPAATGVLRLQSNVQGNSAKESFRLTVSGLTAGSTYQLIAISGEETNSVSVGEFTTDSKGEATVLYSKKGNGNGKKNNLPAELDPLYNLRAVGVANESTQTVLVAWINTSTAYQYLVKRNLTAPDANSTAAGSISLKSNAANTKFNLRAGGLSATNEYHLALNVSNIIQTVSSDANGRLSITQWPALAPAILDLRSLSLLDSSSNVVLTTSLPR